LDDIAARLTVQRLLSRATLMKIAEAVVVSLRDALIRVSCVMSSYACQMMTATAVHGN